MSVLVTGTAGFIGHRVAAMLLARGERVIGIDNLNDYYEVSLKEARLARLQGHPGFAFERLDIADRDAVAGLFSANPDIERIVHLAAQAGVRYSLVNPYTYLRSNIDGHVVLLEAARRLPALRHFVYASSSSVYGANRKMPFAVEDRCDTPVSLYGATKKAMEVISESYAALYGMPLTGLRFFTVYGPWGRPDMAYFSFTRKIIAGEPIPVFNHGDMRRDFTYIDDIVEGVLRVLDKPATPDATFDPASPNPGSSRAPYRIFNIGNSTPTVLMDYIEAIESALGTTATKHLLPIQPGDVHTTHADTSALAAWVGFSPHTPVHEGVARFVRWYRDFYRI